MDETTLGMPDEMPEAEGMEMEGEVLSQSLLGGREVKPGDVVTITVMSVNDDDGTFTASPVEGKKPESGITEMAMAFDQ